MKDFVGQTASSLGFQRAVVAALTPMEAERQEFAEWLSRGYAAGMDYLRRNPHFRTSPQFLYPGATSAIVVSASYYTEPPPDPGPRFGRVARYAVGRDYHAVLRAKLRELKSRLEAHLGRPLIGKAYTDDVALFEQGFARLYGLGFAGKNTLIIGPKLMGSYFFVAELFTDLELPADEPYQGTCGRCFRCGDICPTGAIVSGGTLDAGRCISYLTIENKNGIPLELRPLVGEWVFGCDLCQEVCPYNQRPPKTPWQEFQPEAGVGHHLHLPELLQIDTEDQFRARFANSPLRRPKRRGILRNALIVIGNRRPDGVLAALSRLARSEPDPMLREHACWAIAQYRDNDAKRALETIYLHEREEVVKIRVAEYLNLW